MKNKSDKHTEVRHLVIYGYTRQELKNIMRHFEEMLPEYVRISIDNSSLVTRVTLTGVDSGVELLRFRMNKHQRDLRDLFEHETVCTEDKTISQILGELLAERSLTVSSAESCTGGNIAHRITETPGSSAYFLGSIVSYSNDVKADMLRVPRSLISNYGAVSQQVVEAMSKGVAKVMRSHCSIATSGIAGPDGGTRFKPVGTVWLSVTYGDITVSECQHFKGNRNTVIESATNHGMMMLINLLRKTYIEQEDLNDDF